MRKKLFVVISVGVLIGIMILAGVAAATGDHGDDRTEATGCAGCHSVGNPMLQVVTQWETSAHANSYDGGRGANTYCASCKSPPLADPNATNSNNQPIAQEVWQDVTCSSCHPPHTQRVEWGTPIGVYDVALGDWRPVYDSNELCVYCHSGTHHSKEFKCFAELMYDKKDVKCIDCHMPKVPVDVGGGVMRDTHSHTFSVANNLPYSCGVDGLPCHPNKTTEWAKKQIEKTKIHGK